MRRGMIGKLYADNVSRAYAGFENVSLRDTLPEKNVDFIISVKRITSNTYINSTAYTNDSFIQFSISCLAGGGTASYGGITKTLAASTTTVVTFGKYAGVDDGTPSSGPLTISGNYYQVKYIPFNSAKSTTSYAMRNCLTGVVQWFGSQMLYVDGLFSGNIQVPDAPDLPYRLNIASIGCLMGKQVPVFGDERPANTVATSIPINFIRQLVKLTRAGGAFAGCTGLLSIPEDLFETNELLESVYDSDISGVTDAGAFEGCTHLSSLPSKLFWRQKKLLSLENCFKGCSLLRGSTPVDSLGHKLWERYSRSASGCFTGCSGLVDYADIPADWK